MILRVRRIFFEITTFPNRVQKPMPFPPKPSMKKDDGSNDSLTSWDESPDFMKNKRGQRSPNKKERPKKPTKKKKKKKKKKRKKMREKERRDNATILLPHLCFKVAP